MNQRAPEPEHQAPDGDPPIERLIRPLQLFGMHKLSGAILLIASTAIALVWSNSAFRDSYQHLLHLDLRVGLGGFELEKGLLHWINDGLMGLFFFVVGLEVKREVIRGELSSARKAALPIIAALGGMMIPAGIYALLNYGHPGQHGWGIPMATDIAFALGMLALLGDRVPPALKVFLTALAIADDIGAILVIAVFYTDAIALPSLAFGAVGFALAVGINRLGVQNPVVYFIIGTAVWLAFLESGVHATLAAVLVAMTIPARTRIRSGRMVSDLRQQVTALESIELNQVRGMLAAEPQHIVENMARTLEQGSAPLQRLEHALVPIVTFVVLPVFALANAGVVVQGDLVASLTSRTSLGTAAGLLVGKQLGITTFALLAVKLRLADLPAGVSWIQLHGVAVLGGIGFTMSLFIAGLGFSDPSLVGLAKIGTLVGSLLSAVVGVAILHLTLPRAAGAGEPGG
ncbi:MAG: Na+/H+ antiporter NhaA [Deltaproteobacteria bacterium]|jgi:NhaA family Na+:H+ antiporter|nr:Na+/H+ antiporter NhaA [Deltaproteobacteria bacterium]